MLSRAWGLKASGQGKMHSSMRSTATSHFVVSPRATTWLDPPRLACQKTKAEFLHYRAFFRVDDNETTARTTISSCLGQSQEIQKRFVILRDESCETRCCQYWSARWGFCLFYQCRWPTQAWTAQMYRGIWCDPRPSSMAARERLLHQVPADTFQMAHCLDHPYSHTKENKLDWWSSQDENRRRFWIAIFNWFIK